jgi:hypothetical protein
MSIFFDELVELKRKNGTGELTDAEYKEQVLGLLSQHIQSEMTVQEIDAAVGALTDLQQRGLMEQSERDEIVAFLNTKRAKALRQAMSSSEQQGAAAGAEADSAATGKGKRSLRTVVVLALLAVAVAGGIYFFTTSKTEQGVRDYLASIPGLDEHALGVEYDPLESTVTLTNLDMPLSEGARLTVRQLVLTEPDIEGLQAAPKAEPARFFPIAKAVDATGLIVVSGSKDMTFSVATVHAEDVELKPIGEIVTMLEKGIYSPDAMRHLAASRLTMETMRLDVAMPMMTPTAFPAPTDNGQPESEGDEAKSEPVRLSYLVEGYEASGIKDGDITDFRISGVRFNFVNLPHQGEQPDFVISSLTGSQEYAQAENNWIARDMHMVMEGDMKGTMQVDEMSNLNPQPFPLAIFSAENIEPVEAFLGTPMAQEIRVKGLKANLTMKKPEGALGKPVLIMEMGNYVIKKPSLVENPAPITFPGQTTPAQPYSLSAERAEMEAFRMTMTESAGEIAGNELDMRMARLSVNDLQPTALGSMRLDGLDIQFTEPAGKPITFGFEFFSLTNLDYTPMMKSVSAILDQSLEGDMEKPGLTLLQQLDFFRLERFTLNGLSVDVPSLASVALRELSYAAEDYTQRMPSKTVTELNGFEATLHEGIDPMVLQPLGALGYNPIRGGYKCVVLYDQDNKILNIPEMALHIEKAGRLGFSTKLVDADMSTLAAMVQTHAKLEYGMVEFADQGLTDKLITFLAQMQGADPAMLRQKLIGKTQAVITSAGQSQRFRSLADAAARFLSSPGRIRITADPQAPHSLVALEGASPDTVIEELNVTAAAFDE